MLYDVELTTQLFDKLKPYLPEKASSLSRISTHFTDGYSLCGFNEKLRFYKYGAHEYFAPHYDGHYQREDYLIRVPTSSSSFETFNCTEKSFITVLIYLNDVKSKGGKTNFLKSKHGGEVLWSVKPKQDEFSCSCMEIYTRLKLWKVLMKIHHIRKLNMFCERMSCIGN